MLASEMIQKLREAGLSYYAIAKGAEVFRGIRYREPDYEKIKRWIRGTEPRASEYKRLVDYFSKRYPSQ